MYSIKYFSPTGNVAHLAKKLQGHLGSGNCDVSALEFIDPNQLQKNDHLILIFPVHGFNTPRTVKRFVQNLPPDLYNFVSLIGVGCTTSWMNDAVTYSIRKILIKKNYEVVVDEILAMPLTFIVAFPDELSAKLITESEERIEELQKSISEKKKSIPDVKIKSHLIKLVGKVEGAGGKLFGLELHANNDCTSCGICWSNCPERNIKQGKKGKPQFSYNCLMCMRCIYSCPEKAISPRFSKFIPIKGGYSIKKFRPAE